MRKLLVPCAATLCLAAVTPDSQVQEQQWAAYRAPMPKTIIELQPFRRTLTAPIRRAASESGTARLINLNPAVNVWYLLTLSGADSADGLNYHLENPDPARQFLALGAASDGIEIIDENHASDCDLWAGSPNALERARDSGLPYAPLCENRLYLRNAVAGTYTRIERITELLRDHVWGGDKIVGFVRDTFFRDAYSEFGADRPVSGKPPAAPDAPLPAQLRRADAETAVTPVDLGIDVVAATRDLLLGSWYPVRDSPGIYVSLMRAGAVAEAILTTGRKSVAGLDAVESKGLDYLVAMDLKDFELHFALGTDHPRVGWSDHMLEEERDPKLPGPDGIGSDAPLVRNGMVNPALIPRVAVAFAGGFKREHGAFRFGELALRNAGSHYGFMQEGVIFSKLQPGLATLYRNIDGATRMKTWEIADDASLGRLVDARQNGVPLIEPDPSTGTPAPGSLVDAWGAGSWSGSSEMHLRTVRAGVCLQDTASRHFLIFGFFSTATPSAMTRVFQSYGCRYAMQLDINALEHTYFALYTRRGGQLLVQHLIQGMAVVDRKGGEGIAPRFIGFPDDRDFFYLLRR